MAGTHRTLRRGEYRIEVPAGEGPAGVRRATGTDIDFDIDGGWATFQVAAPESVYFWWRGEKRAEGVALSRVRPRLDPADSRTERRRSPRRVARETTPIAKPGAGTEAQIA